MTEQNPQQPPTPGWPMPDPHAPPGTFPGEPPQYSYNGGRPPYDPDQRDRPNVMLVWLWLFVFSPVVLFLAPSYAGKAKRLGFKETGRYWVPFWLTLAGYAAVIAVIVSVASAVHSLPTYSGSTYTSPTTTAPTTFDGHLSEAAYTVVQGASSTELEMTGVVMDPANNHNWTTVPITGDSQPVAAVCAYNTDTTVLYRFNCNISFKYWVGSFWVSPSGSSYTATQRTSGSTTAAPTAAPTAATVVAPPTTGRSAPTTAFLTQDPSNLVNSTKYIVQDSEPIADATIGKWIAQVGAWEDPMKAMRGFTNLQLKGHSDVIMVWSGDYTSFMYANNYVILIPRTFSTAAEANSWCDSGGFATGDCFAKRLSHTDGPAGNNVDR